MPDVLKRIESALADRYTAERFLREIKLIAYLAHPRVLPLLDSGKPT